MPVRPLPKALVARLKRIAPRLVEEKFRKTDSNPVGLRLSQMRNMDYRFSPDRRVDFRFTTVPGTRVREMNVSRNHPGLRVVLKRVHEVTAQETIAEVQARVQTHNRAYKPKRYKVLMPHGHAISDRLIAMAKVTAPTCLEVLVEDTPRGKKMATFLREKGISRNTFDDISHTAAERLDIDRGNLMLLDFKGGKLVIMPLLDYY